MKHGFASIDLKIGTHIDWTDIMYLAKTCIDKNNLTYVSMAMQYPIINHRAFFLAILTFRATQLSYPVPLMRLKKSKLVKEFTVAITNNVAMGYILGAII